MMSKERPILFSAPMVRAILDGRKTQTRRIVRKQFTNDAEPAEVSSTSPEGWQISGHSGLWWDDAGACIDDAIKCPFGIPGDQLWVRENFSGPNYQSKCSPKEWSDSDPIWYWVDGNPDSGDWTKPKPSIHMPRWASRITLEIVRVRVERLQDISYEDSLAEGVSDFRKLIEPECQEGESADQCARRLCWPQRSYRQLWESINGAGSWDINPWVWVVSFKKIEA